MTEKFANNAIGSLSAGINNSVTSLSLQSGEGAAFPASGDFRIVIDAEIIIVGARSTDTLSSLTRGAEGTTAATHAVDATVTLVTTAGSLDSFVQDTGDETIAGIKTFSSIPVGPASDPSTANQLARKSYVDTKVSLTGAETVAGVKTFSSIPEGPASNPTTDNQLARKAYVDTKQATSEKGAASGYPALDANAKLTGTYKAYAAKTSAYTATATDDIIDCTSGTFTVTLPTAVGIAGKELNIKNSGTGVITIDGNAAETIDGDATKTITTRYQVLTLVSNGSNWVVI